MRLVFRLVINMAVPLSSKFTLCGGLSCCPIAINYAL